MDDSVKQKVTPEISAEENWLRHFQSLHSNDLLNPDHQNVVNELRKQQDSKMQSRPLDYPITELEIRTAVKKLKNNKSPYSDKIRNEMIEASLNEMMPVCHKLFNNILNGGSMPLMWCSGLITPIFKSGGRNDPTNYRGICVSSCLGKLFCSILNQRLMEHVNSLNILHNSQIGFLPNNRTADHVLTLRTLIDKYVHCHQEKVYACFVDVRKAFEPWSHLFNTCVSRRPVIIDTFHRSYSRDNFLQDYVGFCNFFYHVLVKQFLRKTDSGLMFSPSDDASRGIYIVCFKPWLSPLTKTDIC